MPTYVVATRREAQASSSTAEDFVRQVPGVWVKGGTDPNRITIDASELAADEIERRFGSVLLIEPELVLKPPSNPERPRRVPGMLQGKIRMAEDFDVLPTDILSAMERSGRGS